MKITITGASGFVGKNLLNYLRNSHEIECESFRYVLNQKIEFTTNAIIHLAGKAHDLKKVSNPKEYYQANFELTKQIFDSFLASEAEVFIFMSTVKAVADQVKGILTEEVIPNPKTHYGIAKQQAEQYILSKKLPVGKKIYILRPCMIHGPGNKGNLNLLYQIVSKGVPWPLGIFNNERSFLSIENLCFVIKELLERKNISSGIYNVSDDEFLSTNELIIILGESLKNKVRILKVPIKLIKFVAIIGDSLKLPANTETLQKLTENYKVSNEKIVNAIGIPLPLSSREGMKITFNSFNIDRKKKN